MADQNIGVIVSAPDANDPSQDSIDRAEMRGGWGIISDILEGQAIIKGKGRAYLPQRPRESDGAYSIRLAQAPWRPEFEDGLRSICAKPFTQVVRVNTDAPDDVQGKLDENTKKRSGGIVDNIDGQGNSLHVFAREAFWYGVGFGLEAIYVTYPDVIARTVAEEKAVGARPYWVHIRGQNIIACTFRMVADRQVVEHIRWRENTIERSGFVERLVERVRVVELDENDKPAWFLYIKGNDGKYTLEKEGRLLGVDGVPVAIVYMGPRFGSWGAKPPLMDLAHMQLELYRAASGTERIMTLSNAPMLVGAGFGPPAPTPILDKDGNQTGENPAPVIEVGPGIVLFAPATVEGVQPTWEYIAPQSSNVEQARQYEADIKEDFRRLALQPMTPKSGNMVATGQAIDAAKSHSAVEAWANGLKDALDLAFTFTMQWLKRSDTVTTVVHTDFGVELSGEGELNALSSMQARNVISAQTEREEAQRRGVLGPQFDEDEEIERLAAQAEAMEPEFEIDPVTGERIEIDPVTGERLPPTTPPAGGTED